MEDEEFHPATVDVNNGGTDDGWRKVTYAKRRRKPFKPTPAASVSNKIVSDGRAFNGHNTFRPLEQLAEDRRRRVENDVSDRISPVKSQIRSHGEAAFAIRKTDKGKKPMVTIAEAAAKIDANRLSSCLANLILDVANPETQLVVFTHYFLCTFSKVQTSQFPWLKLYKESAEAELANFPLNQLSEAVCQISAEWLRKRPVKALNLCVLWCVDYILSELPAQQSEDAASPQVGPFVVLAMTLRSKPQVLLDIMPNLMQNRKYHQGLHELRFVMWMILQASRGDRAVGFNVWGHVYFSIFGCFWYDSRYKDHVSQLVERMLSEAKARTILANGARNHRGKQPNLMSSKNMDEDNVDDLEARLVVLEQLSEEWKKICAKLLPPNPIWETLKNLWSRMKMLWLKVLMVLNVQSFTRQTDMVR